MAKKTPHWNHECKKHPKQWFVSCVFVPSVFFVGS
jgi:hypothetical protein